MEQKMTQQQDELKQLSSELLGKISDITMKKQEMEDSYEHQIMSN